MVKDCFGRIYVDFEGGKSLFRYYSSRQNLGERTTPFMHAECVLVNDKHIFIHSIYHSFIHPFIHIQSEKIDEFSYQ